MAQMTGDGSGNRIELEAGSVMILINGGSGTITIEAGSSMNLSSPIVMISDSASEPVIKGTTFNLLLTALVTVLGTHYHTSLGESGGQSPTLAPAATAFLAAMTTYLSEKVTTG